MTCACRNEGALLERDSFFSLFFLSSNFTSSCTQKNNQLEILNSSCVVGMVSKWNTARSKKCSTICEILDHHTEKTIASNKSVACKSDFVQSNSVISQIIVCLTSQLQSLPLDCPTHLPTLYLPLRCVRAKTNCAGNGV
jgi:hypothetical protein